MPWTGLCSRPRTHRSLCSRWPSNFTSASSDSWMMRLGMPGAAAGAAEGAAAGRLRRGGIERQQSTAGELAGQGALCGAVWTVRGTKQTQGSSKLLAASCERCAPRSAGRAGLPSTNPLRQLPAALCLSSCVEPAGRMPDPFPGAEGVSWRAACTSPQPSLQVAHAARTTRLGARAKKRADGQAEQDV